jgi:hypothetical protein
VYPTGDIDRILPIDYILHETESAYDTNSTKGAYKSIDPESGKIILNTSAAASLKDFSERNILRKGTTVLINHFETGTYVIGKVLHDQLVNWTKCTMDFQGFSRENCHTKFLESTRYIRLVVMSNFNSGYPQFNVEHKEAELSFG